jgi:phosphoglycerate kinase
LLAAWPTLAAQKGINVGKSLCEHDLADTARDYGKAETAGCTLLLPGRGCRRRVQGERG